MKHLMNLRPAPFEMIKAGKKTIEMRLYDEKRKAVHKGDTILFTNTDTQETIEAAVKDLYIFDSFADLYENLNLLECGYTEENISSADPEDMNQYYSKKNQKLYGVIGIRIHVI